MNWQFLTSSILTAFFVFSSGCTIPAGRSTQNSLITIGDKSLFLSDLALRLVQIPGLKGAKREIQEKVAHETLESLVDDQLLYLEAKKHGFRVSDAMVEHAIQQHETLLGSLSFSYFAHKNHLSQKALREKYREQLTALEFLKKTHLKDKSLCLEGFEMQFPQKCIKRQDFLRELREKYGVVVGRELSKSALSAILESVI